MYLMQIGPYEDDLKVVDPIRSLKMWDWIKIMASRIKYCVGTLLNPLKTIWLCYNTHFP